MSTTTIERTRTLGNGEPYCAPRARVRWEGGVEVREVPEYPDYWAGEDGSIWSSKRFHGVEWRRINQCPNRDGYLSFSISYKSKVRSIKSHHAVLLAFYGPRPHSTEANHEPDANPTNNHASNLHWGTKSENIKEKYSSGRNQRPQGELHPQSKLTERDVCEIRSLYSTGRYTQKSISTIYNVTRQAIGDIINRRNWPHVT